MSKINEQLQQLQEVQQAYYWKFMDFVYDNLVNSELSDDEINKLEETQNRASSTSKQIVSQLPLNNSAYNPQLGA